MMSKAANNKLLAYQYSKIISNAKTLDVSMLMFIISPLYVFSGKTVRSKNTKFVVFLNVHI
jgi:hypothetical protein